MATQGVQMKFQGVQNATFDENHQENERIWAILGCAISSIARAKHRCTGGWLKLWVSTTRVLVLPKMINMNILKTLYSSTDFPVLVLVCRVLAPALLYSA